MTISVGSALYGRRRATLAEWAVLATRPRDMPCRWMLGCPGLATGWSRDRTTTKLVTACDAHKGHW